MKKIPFFWLISYNHWSYDMKSWWCLQNSKRNKYKLNINPTHISLWFRYIICNNDVTTSSTRIECKLKSNPTFTLAFYFVFNNNVRTVKYLKCAYVKFQKWQPWAVKSDQCLTWLVQAAYLAQVEFLMQWLVLYFSYAS